MPERPDAVPTYSCGPARVNGLTIPVSSDPGRPMPDESFTPAYVANLRRELTRALARLKRAERERDEALAENARLRDLVERSRADRDADPN